MKGLQKLAAVALPILIVAPAALASRSADDHDAAQVYYIR